MTALAISRRAVVQSSVAGAVVVLAAGLPGHALARDWKTAFEPDGSGMIAAWVLLRPEAGADVRLAWLDARGRLLHELPAVQLDAAGMNGAGGASSAWGQAQEASAHAQTLARVMLANAWGVPASECEVRTGQIVHTPSGRALRHCVWIDVG